jgi:hypothetical protein
MQEFEDALNSVPTQKKPRKSGTAVAAGPVPVGVAKPLKKVPAQLL